MAKNVLYVVPSAGFGGAETFLLHTASFHHLEEFRPVYACLRDGPLVEKLRGFGHPVHLAPKSPRLSKPVTSASSVLWLSSLIESEKIDIVHSTLAYGALFGAMAAKLKNVPHVWFQHGPVTGWLDRIAGLLPASFILVNSSHTAKAQIALGTNRPTKFLRIGVNLDKEAISLDKASVRELLAKDFYACFKDSTEFLSVMIARPQPQKGIELWLEANSLLRKNGVRAAALLIGGSQHPTQYENRLEANAKLLEVPFLRKPATAYPWRLARGADALICASIEPEGYGLTLAEANAHGIPAIAPREGGPLDIIEEMKNGLFFTPREASDLAKVMQQIAEKSSLPKALIENGFRFAEESLNPKESLRNLEEFYQRELS